MLTVYMILDALNFVLFAVGAVICFRAARARKNAGYWVLVAYFVLTFASLGIARVRHARHDAERLRQAQANPPAQSVAVPVRNASLPLMPLILVGGVWLVAKNGNERTGDGTTSAS